MNIFKVNRSFLTTMNVLNDYYPLVHGPNPITEDLSDSEISENEQHIAKLQHINENRMNKKRKKEYSFDDWCMIYSDDLWYLWGVILEFKRSSFLLDKMDFSSFCEMCYDNSGKK